jgi:hypothetical protein
VLVLGGGFAAAKLGGALDGVFGRSANTADSGASTGGASDGEAAASAAGAPEERLSNADSAKRALEDGAVALSSVLLDSASGIPSGGEWVEASASLSISAPDAYILEFLSIAGAALDLQDDAMRSQFEVVRLFANSELALSMIAGLGADMGAYASAPAPEFGASAAWSVGGERMLSLEAFAAGGEMLLKIPELSEMVLKMPADLDYALDALNESMSPAALGGISAYAEQASPIVDRLLRIALSHIGYAEAGSETMSLGGRQVALDAVELTITQRSLLDAGLAVLRDIRGDEAAVGIIVGFWNDVLAPANYEEPILPADVTDGLDSLIAQLDMLAAQLDATAGGGQGAGAAGEAGGGNAQSAAGERAGAGGDMLADGGARAFAELGAYGAGGAEPGEGKAAGGDGAESGEYYGEYGAGLGGAFGIEKVGISPKDGAFAGFSAAGGNMPAHENMLAGSNMLAVGGERAFAEPDPYGAGGGAGLDSAFDIGKIKIYLKDGAFAGFSAAGGGMFADGEEYGFVADPASGYVAWANTPYSGTELRGSLAAGADGLDGDAHLRIEDAESGEVFEMKLFDFSGLPLALPLPAGAGAGAAGAGERHFRLSVAASDLLDAFAGKEDSGISGVSDMAYTFGDPRAEFFRGAVFSIDVPYGGQRLGSSVEFKAEDASRGASVALKLGAAAVPSGSPSRPEGEALDVDALSYDESLQAALRDELLDGAGAVIDKAVGQGYDIEPLREMIVYGIASALPGGGYGGVYGGGGAGYGDGYGGGADYGYGDSGGDDGAYGDSDSEGGAYSYGEGQTGFDDSELRDFVNTMVYSGEFAELYDTVDRLAGEGELTEDFDSWYYSLGQIQMRVIIATVNFEFGDSAALEQAMLDDAFGEGRIADADGYAAASEWLADAQQAVSADELDFFWDAYMALAEAGAM